MELMMKTKKVIISICLALLSICCLVAGVACKDSTSEKEPVKVELSLFVGESMTLKTTYDSYLLAWESSDELTVAVDSYGKITALKEGSATVTASVGTQKIIYTLQIQPQEIVQEEEVVVSEYMVRLNATKIDCLCGSSYVIEADVLVDGMEVDKTVTWTVEDVAPYENVLTMTANGNSAHVKTTEVGIAKVLATVEGYSASCQVVSHAENLQTLTTPEATVVDGEKVEWTSVENATAYAVSYDGGITWSSVGMQTKLENFLEGPESCEILVKALGDSLYYSNSNSTKVVFRNKMNLYYDGEALSLIPYNNDALYVLYNEGIAICEDLEAINFTKEELTELCNARKLNLKVGVQGTDVESNTVAVAVPWDVLSFEYDYDQEYIATTSQLDNVEVVTYESAGITKPAGRGDYLIKGQANDAMPTMTFDFGRVLPKGTAIKFSLYVANTDTERWGWFPIVVNGKNQSYLYAYWVNTGSWDAKWSNNTWVLEKASSTLSICANIGEFYPDDGMGTLDYSHITMYIDNIFIVEQYDNLDFENDIQLMNVSSNGTMEIVSVADEVAAGTLTNAEGLGDRLLKISACPGEPVMSFDFGTTYAAGTKLQFSVYVHNTNGANEQGWFTFNYPGYETNYGDMGSIYWANGTSFKSYWATYTVTLTQATSVLTFAAKTGLGWADCNINNANLVLYFDYVKVIG